MEKENFKPQIETPELEPQLTDEEKIESVKTQLQGKKYEWMDFEDEDLKKLAVIYWQYPEALMWIWGGCNGDGSLEGKPLEINKEIFCRKSVYEVILQLERDKSGEEACLISRISELMRGSNRNPKVQKEKEALLTSYLSLANVYKEAPGVIEDIGRELERYPRNKFVKFLQNPTIKAELIGNYNNLEAYFYKGFKELSFKNPSAEAVIDYIHEKIDNIKNEIDTFVTFNEFLVLLEHITSVKKSIEGHSYRRDIFNDFIKDHTLSYKQVESIKQFGKDDLDVIDQLLDKRIKEMGREVFIEFLKNGHKDYYKTDPKSRRLVTRSDNEKRFQDEISIDRIEGIFYNIKFSHEKLVGRLQATLLGAGLSYQLYTKLKHEYNLESEYA